jgi:allophanate hydrolase subunit 2
MLHSYIAVKGGLQSTLWLKSRSQSWVENELGFAGNILRTGDQVALNSKESSLWSLAQASQPSTSQADFYEEGLLHLRFIPSSLFLSLTSYQQKQFIEQSYVIEAQSNRMAYRLHGSIALRQLPSTLSKPVSYGNIQLPNQGQPIILMKERQTIGGYPIFGTVIQTDLFRLSQKRPGEKICFIAFKLAQAQAQLAAFFQRFN